MTPQEAQHARGRRRARILRIRKTVAALALALFIALFSTIYVQLAAGRDPVLSAQSATKNAATSAPSDTSTSTDQPAAVTTSQS